MSPPDSAPQPSAADPRRFAAPSVISAFIDGEAVPSHGSFTIPAIDPATETQIATLLEDDAAAVDQAVRAARRAFDEGPWPHLDLAERRSILNRVRDVLIAHADELAAIDCMDTGVPLWDIAGRKISRVAENFAFFMDVASTAHGETYQQNKKYVTLVTREPMGVAAILAPWNSPMSLASMQIAPAIAFGNSCVVKPSEHTPVSLFRMVQLMHEAGLPRGVVNLVNGRGPVTGAALVAHPGVDMVKFIGGTNTGRSILAGAAPGLKRVGLELGGKSANIIFDDADFDDALTGALLSIYSNNGQQCLAGSRILVQRGIADRFIAAFAARAAAIKVGDPFDPMTEVGPLAFKEHYEKVLSYVDIAKADGAQVIAGGGRAPGFAKGHYFSPTAVLARSNAARVCQEEIFGPFASFIVFDTVEEAVRIANDTRFGLVAYLWSQNVRTTMSVSQKLRAGTVWVNTPLVREVRAPFGGFKESGIGRDGARDSLDFYTEAKTTTVPLERIAMRPIGTGADPKTVR
jgi:acyl-CoA reductase-like NAD-dependent aldehyde dehydrogenase